VQAQAFIVPSEEVTFKALPVATGFPLAPIGFFRVSFLPLLAEL
jgi:hypothetical protein